MEKTRSKFIASIGFVVSTSVALFFGLILLAFLMAPEELDKADQIDQMIQGVSWVGFIMFAVVGLEAAFNCIQTREYHLYEMLRGYFPVNKQAYKDLINEINEDKRVSKNSVRKWISLEVEGLYQLNMEHYAEEVRQWEKGKGIA